ncbi:hypothetical protein K1719_010995 [Acacia pycnantha]|nr:hypothetical protein K1719_010995 [Acacia pycnantha]
MLSLSTIMERIATTVLLICLFSFLLDCNIHFEASSFSIDAIPETTQPYRTSYHFQPSHNWMNDPNGPMYYKGVYHLFYQYNPYAATFGDRIVWAHSVSYDLINWIHLNIAIEPSQPYDINSCWSGSATILPGEKPVILYTGLDPKKNEVQNLATPKNLSDPFLREWIKHPRNPIMTPPIGVELDNFRDPSTAWLGKDGKWRVIIGAQNGDEGKVILGQTENFVFWTVDSNPFYLSENTGVVECPDFYPVSIEDQNSFIPDTKFTGTSLDLRRILWGWVNESDTRQDDIDKGWAGLQAIPRQVWLDKSGKRLVQWPVEEVEKLRKNPVSINGEKLMSKSLLEVSEITASQADVEVLFKLSEIENAEEIDPTKVDPQILCSEEDASKSGTIGPFGLSALASKDKTEQTSIFFRIYKAPNRYVGLMCSDQSRSSLRKDLDKTIYGSFFDVDPKIRTISLRSLIDHSIIESFGEGGRVCITSRVYPSLAIHENAHLYVFNNGSQSVTVSKLNAWSMKKAEIGHQDTTSYF